MKRCICGDDHENGEPVLAQDGLEAILFVVAMAAHGVVTPPRR